MESVDQYYIRREDEDGDIDFLSVGCDGSYNVYYVWTKDTVKFFTKLVAECLCADVAVNSDSLCVCRHISKLSDDLAYTNGVHQ